MISFILIAVVLILLAVAFLVPTLRKKNYAFSDEYDDLNVEIAKERLKELKLQLKTGEIDQPTYQQLHEELESTLALDLSNASEAIAENVKEKNTLSPILLALAVPVMAAGIYYELGDFAAATNTRVENTVIPAGKARPQMTIEEAVGKLEQRLAEDPENPDGWFMLGKTYMVMKNYHKAAGAYKKVIDIVGDDPDILMRYADALAMTDGGRLTGDALPVVEKMFKLAPDNPTILWMTGTAEQQQGNYAKALTLWYKLFPMLSQDAASQTQLSTLINEAESHLTKSEIAALKQAAPEQKVVKTPTAMVAGITVSVDLDPALKDKVSASDTLFIFAKAMQGPPMPLAAVKKTVAALPLTVTLNDAMAMMPQMKLSNFEQVKISAVISKSGQPGKQPGDLYVELSPVNVKSNEEVFLIINQVK